MKLLWVSLLIAVLSITNSSATKWPWEKTAGGASGRPDCVSNDMQHV